MSITNLSCMVQLLMSSSHSFKMGVSIIGTSLWFPAVYKEGQSPWIFRTWVFESRVATTQIPHPQSDLIYLVYENIDWLIDVMTVWSHGSLRNVEYVLCTAKTWITGAGGKTVTKVESSDSQLPINIISQEYYFRGFVFVHGISANSLDAEIP